MKEVFPVDTFKELILTEFEGRMLPVPKKYDQFLTQMYGDYMTPPSKEMQEWYSHSIKSLSQSWLSSSLQENITKEDHYASFFLFKLLLWQNYGFQYFEHGISCI